MKFGAILCDDLWRGRSHHVNITLLMDNAGLLPVRAYVRQLVEGVGDSLTLTVSADTFERNTFVVG